MAQPAEMAPALSPTVRAFWAWSPGWDVEFPGEEEGPEAEANELVDTIVVLKVDVVEIADTRFVDCGVAVVAIVVEEDE